MSACTHGITFDKEAADALLAGWKPGSAVDYVVGNPASAEIRKRWPRGWFTAEKPCPLGCDYRGIYYASMDHYLAGDW